MAAGGPGVRGGMHAAGVNAGPSAGTFYSQGSAGSAAGEHDLQLTALGPAHRQLIANVQRLLRVQLPRGERLADLIAQHVGVPLLLPARDGFVPGLAQKKFRVGGEGVALIGSDQSPVQGLDRVLAIVKAVRHGLQDRLASADMVGL